MRSISGHTSQNRSCRRFGRTATVAKKKTASIECSKCGARHHYNKRVCPKCGAENQRRRQRETAISAERHFELLEKTAAWAREIGGIEEAKKRLDEVAELIEALGGLEQARQYLEQWDQLRKNHR